MVYSRLARVDPSHGSSVTQNVIRNQSLCFKKKLVFEALFYNFGHELFLNDNAHDIPATGYVHSRSRKQGEVYLAKMPQIGIAIVEKTIPICLFWIIPRNYPREPIYNYSCE